jgi:hypothetical protein
MGTVGLLLLAIAAFGPKARMGRSARSLPLTAIVGLLAPGIEAALIVLLRHAWGPTSEEYTGMPDVWAPLALITGVLLVCLASTATGVQLSWALSAAAVAVPVVTLIQAASLEWAVSSHGVTEPARLPLVYPVGQEHPLALALSGVAVSGLLVAALLIQEHRSAANGVGLAAFLVSSIVVTALLVVDASRDAYSFAPLGVRVWLPSLAASALLAGGAIYPLSKPGGRQ